MIRDEGAFRKAKDALSNARFVENPIGHDLFDEAVDLYRLAQAKRITVRSSVDCLISACAIRHGLTVVHRDRDFSYPAGVSALVEQRV